MNNPPSELPSAEIPFEHEGVDTNAQTKKRQTLKWALVATVIALPLGWYAWSSLKGPTRPGSAEDARHIRATALIAEGDPNDLRQQNEDLASKLRQAQTQLTQVQAENITLQGENTQLAQQRDQERTDAQRTIDALDRNRAAQTRDPVVGGMPGPPARAATGGAAQPSQGLAGAPLPGVNPFAPVGALRPGTSPAPPEAVARPHRTMEVIRATAPAAGATPGPVLQSTSSSSPTGGAAGEGVRGAPVPAGFFSGAFSTYESARYVPPNAYATARVLVGVDAATGTSFSSDPKPVLLRIIGPATHVGTNGRFQTTKLEGCVVNGAAYGELASEKVYIKLQRITCPAGPGKFSVATVEGYVTHKGKAGVRGLVISREGPLTRRALTAGALNGLGQGLSQNLSRSVGGSNLTGAGGASSLLGTERLSPEEIAQGAVGSGVAGAASMLAEYYIKRAEQYQPVIEMPTGIEVEIVFLSGFQIQ